MRRFVSIGHVSLVELIGLTGWEAGPSGDSVMDGHGNEVFVREDDDGRLTITVHDGVDAADLLEQVPFEEVEDA